MSPPPVPSFFASTIAVGRLTLLRTLRGRKLRVALVATFLVVVFPGVVAIAGEPSRPSACAVPCADGEVCVDDPADDCDPENGGRRCAGICRAGGPIGVVNGGIDWGFFRLLVFLLPILFTSGAIGEEVEGRTLHFLAMRPVSRGAIALGKYLVGTAAGLVVLWIGLILLHVVGYATSPTLMIDQAGDTARAGGAASLLILAYSGICLFWGALVPEAAGMVSIVWLGFVEWFLATLPYILRCASLSFYARELGGLERAGIDADVPDFELWICGVVVVCGWLLFTGLGVLTVQLSELRFGKA
jgi:hypothetical protein